MLKTVPSFTRSFTQRRVQDDVAGELLKVTWTWKGYMDVDRLHKYMDVDR